MYILRSIARKNVARATNDLLNKLDLPHDANDILTLKLERNELTVTAVTGVKVDWEGKRTPETTDYKYIYTGQ